MPIIVDMIAPVTPVNPAEAFPDEFEELLGC
jgi:hypothetical protein